MSLPIKLNIPESFYKEETICGHFVSSKEKKIWAVELDLLNEFKQVCDRYNLRWYMAYGSLLGTIRHKGFIPWDNDVDIAMPRSDFRKLCEIADKEFLHPYFLSTPLSEKGRYYASYAKLRNSLTTGGAEDTWLQGINNGLFIDIFILDDIPDSDKDASMLVKKAHYYEHFTRFLSPYPRRYKGLKHLKNLYWELQWKYRYGKCKGDFIFKKIDELLGSTIGKGYKRIGIILGLPGSSYKPSRMMDKSLYDVIWTPYEMLQVPVPAGYDAILRSFYGDYMQFPPESERATHPYLDMEPEIPYTQYYKNIK